MTKPRVSNADKPKLNRTMIANGYYYGLNKIVDEYEVTDEQFRKIKSGLAKHLLVKIKEAKKEVMRLQASVDRLEAACQAAAVVSPADGQKAFTPAVNMLVQELRTFDGWTISLLETDISLLATIDNPDTAGIRVKGLVESFTNLWNARLKDYKPFDNYPQLFDMAFFVP